MDKPQISVIMPVYNAEKYVGEAIQSVLDQTFIDFEFIIIDDGSIDRSWEMIQYYAQKDPRIKPIKNLTNKRLVYTRNIALSHINPKSQYVGICDADDTVSRDRLRESYDYMQKKPNISVVGVDLQYTDKDGKPGKELHYPKKPKEKKKVIFRMSPMSHGGSLIRIADWKKIGFYYDETFLRAHDYELRSRFIKNGFALAGIENNERTFHRVSGGEQGKRKYLKLTIRNSLRIQWGLWKKGIRPGWRDMPYVCAELLFYILPTAFVFWLFKKIRGVK